MWQEKSFISSAMVTSIWETSKKDTIELIIPFVKTILYELYEENDEVFTKDVAEQMDKKFSFKSFPIAVIKKVFARLSKEKNRVLCLNNKKYYYNKKDKSEYDNFIQKQKNTQDKIEFLIEDMRNFFKVNISKLKNITRNQTEEYIMSFLDTYGYIFFKREQIQNISQSGYCNCCVGKYIENISNKKSEMMESFNYIVNGYMISKAIYIESHEKNENKKLKEKDIYIDSPLILAILELKTDEENESAKQMVELLKRNKFNLKMFSHSVEETRGIIKEYLNTKNNFSAKRLEALDKMQVPDTVVNAIIGNLESKIEKKGIIIEQTPNYDSKNIFIDQNRLYNSFIDYYGENAKNNTIDNDVKSICAISSFRGNNTIVNSIEKCSTLFVTKNSALVKISNGVIGNEDGIGYVITDSDLITFLWLKSGKTMDTISRLKLIENSRLALEPSAKLTEKFISTVESMKENNIISEEDKEFILCDIYKQKEKILEMSQGEIENINETAILSEFNESRSSTQGKTKSVDIESYLPIYVNPYMEISDKLATLITNIIFCVIYTLFIIAFFYFFEVLIEALLKDREWSEFKVIFALVYNILEIIIALCGIFKKIDLKMTKLKNYCKNNIYDFILRKILKR